MANQFLFGFLLFAFFYDNVIAVRYMHVSIYKSNTYKGKKLLKRMKRKPLSHVHFRYISLAKTFLSLLFFPRTISEWNSLPSDNYNFVF